MIITESGLAQGWCNLTLMDGGRGLYPRKRIKVFPQHLLGFQCSLLFGDVFSGEDKLLGVQYFLKLINIGLFYILFQNYIEAYALHDLLAYVAAVDQQKPTIPSSSRTNEILMIEVMYEPQIRREYVLFSFFDIPRKMAAAKIGI
jgi:hypothetical protein